MRILFIFLILLHIAAFKAFPNEKLDYSNESFTRSQIRMDANNISTWIQNSGTFNQDIRETNVPGFMWPKGSNKFAIYSTGLTIAASVNNALRMAACSYIGEYRPGYCQNEVFHTDSTFKFYKITAGDNEFNNPDYANWGLMIPYGAPYQDLNQNGIYEPDIDKPGIKNAQQLIFICMTDADSSAHTSGEGFGGGTSPLFAEIHWTIWCYDTQGLENMQFLKWDIFNKGTTTWENTRTSIVCDPDLGDANDDYIGCDTTNWLNLAYCYNADNVDGTGSGITYGANPPAVGIMFLNQKLTSFDFFENAGAGGPFCQATPHNVLQAYNFMKGLKNDATPFLYPEALVPTKFCYPGNPVSFSGWSERGTNGNSNQARVQNCGGSLTGTPQSSPPGDRRFVMSYGDSNASVLPNGKQTLVAAQLMARNNINLSSITKLLRLANTAKLLYDSLLSVSISVVNNIIVPNFFSLYQNYPNPFNPVTKIKFDIPQIVSGQSSNVKLKIFDIMGKEIAVLVNQHLNPGTYEAEFDGSSFASGVYFYRLETESFSEMKKMVLVK